MGDFDLLLRGGRVVVPGEVVEADVAGCRRGPRRDRRRVGGASSRRDRCPRAHGDAGLHRSPRPSQRPRHRLGGVRDGNGRVRGGRRHVPLRHAAQRGAADCRCSLVRPQARGGARQSQRSTSASGAASSRAGRSPRRARRSRRRRVQGVHVRIRQRRVPARRRSDAPRGDDACGAARTPGRRSCRERRDHRGARQAGPRGWAHVDARLPRVAPGDRRARGGQPRDLARRRRPGARSISST